MKAIRRMLTFTVVAAVVVVALVALSVYFGATRWHSPRTVEVVIEKGMSLREIASKLSAEKAIGTPRLFEVIGRVRGLGRALKAGTYEFPAGLTMPEVMEMIARGQVKQYPLIVIEGWTIDEIAKALEGQLFLADAGMPARFVKLAKDPAEAKAMGFAGAVSLEGYLFPETYLFAKPLSEAELIKKMTAQFNDVWNGLLSEGAPENTMAQKDIVTLASVIEKETGDPGERPMIASVFLNRLKIGMPLQSDPTIIYGLADYDGNIKKEDISNPHSYNTYVHPGLPPGPICNPGKASLYAALHPAHTDYLYFVSRKDGTHEFTATLAEHMIAVKRYQLGGGNNGSNGSKEARAKGPVR